MPSYSKIYCVIAKSVPVETEKLAGFLVICRNRYFQETLFNESASVHVDCRGLFRRRCSRISGFNWSVFHFQSRFFVFLTQKTAFEWKAEKTCNY